MTYATDIEFELARATKMVRKDHKQRWVFHGPNGAAISETPIPYKWAISVYWLPVHRCVAYSHREPALAHPAIGAV